MFIILKQLTKNTKNKFKNMEKILKYESHADLLFKLLELLIISNAKITNINM